MVRRVMTDETLSESEEDAKNEQEFRRRSRRKLYESAHSDESSESSSN